MIVRCDIVLGRCLIQGSSCIICVIVIVGHILLLRASVKLVAVGGSLAELRIHGIERSL